MAYKASVIIPVYNAEKTLRRCVESIALGRERNVEVILSEDCSKDGSWDLCRELAEEFSNVRCIQNKNNRGVSYTRNQGLAAATGDYIFFVDSDDWVSSRYIWELLKLAEENCNSLVMCCLRFINKTENYLQDFFWEKRTDLVNYVDQSHFFDLVDAFFIQSPCNKVFHRKLIETYQIRFDETQSMGEDFQFVLDYMEAAKIKQCVVLNKPLYYYIRWNSTSLMSKFGLIQSTQEFARAEQLHRISGDTTTARRDAMIQRTKQNYIYHIVRNTNLTKQEKLDAIEQIMQDGNSINHYRDQMRLHGKEKAAAVLTAAKHLPARLHGRISRMRMDRKTAFMRRKVQVHGISLISQNCIGGVLYHDLRIQFSSPTINLFFSGPDFVKFAANLPHYISCPLHMRWEEEYPVGTLDGIEIHFVHYSTCMEAKQAWERRKTRINWDKILILCTDRDGFDDTSYEQWKQIPYPKLLFTANPNYTEDSLYFPEFAKDGMVGDLISNRNHYGETLFQKLKYTE